MPKNNRLLHIPFWLFTSTIIIVIISQLVQEGVFMDGMLYIAVSKNLALGYGTFWNPFFSQTAMASFHEQPPLYFGLLALFYKALGTSVYVEQLFCLICFFITTFFIHKIWKIIFIDNHVLAAFSWLPILFWITIPVCNWAYTNHVEETLMSVFTAASVYYLLKALYLKKQVYFNILIAGLLIFLASLTKGFQGLFPLVSIISFWIVFKNQSFLKAFFQTMTLVLIPISIYVILMTDDTVYQSFKDYFEIRILGTFNNKGATTQNRFELLLALLQELLPIIGITLLFYLLKRKTISINNQTLKMSYWFAIIALAGSLPLMLTLEQRRFYLVTSLPFFALQFSILTAPYLCEVLSKINIKSQKFKVSIITLSLLLIASIIFTVMQIGKYKRDKELITDIHQINTVVSPESIIDMPIDMANDWSMITYFIRYHNISLNYADTSHHYFIIRKDLPIELIPKSFHKITCNTQLLEVYKK